MPAACRKLAFKHCVANRKEMNRQIWSQICNPANPDKHLGKNGFLLTFCSPANRESRTDSSQNLSIVSVVIEVKRRRQPGVVPDHFCIVG